MIVIVDYGMGNLRSVQKAFEKVGAEATVTRDPELVARADKLVLPGVGAFRDAMSNLQEQSLVEPIRDFLDAGRPTRFPSPNSVNICSSPRTTRSGRPRRSRSLTVGSVPSITRR